VHVLNQPSGAPIDDMLSVAHTNRGPGCGTSGTGLRLLTVMLGAVGCTTVMHLVKPALVAGEDD
jgi:hypothetical protein